MRFIVAAVLLCVASAFAQDPAPAKPSDADAKAKTDAWSAAVKNKSDDEKKAAIEGMADCPHPSVISLLAKILVGETEENRIAAANALGRMKDSVEAAKACHAAIKPNEENDKVVTAIFAAMGEINNPASVAVAKEWGSHDLGARDSEDIPTIRCAIECLGAMKWKSAVEAVLDIWRKNRVVGRDRGSTFRERVRKYCNTALGRLVGERFGNYEEAEDWWKENSKKYNVDLSPK
jgi:HEAT repeat protein